MMAHLIRDVTPPPSTPGGRDDLRGSVSAMLEQERHYQCRDYLGLKGSNRSTTENTRSSTEKNCGAAAASVGNGRVTAASRVEMCRWIFHAVECAGLRKETAVGAITLLDRFSSSKSSPRAQRARTNFGDYQLVALASLFISIKTTEAIEIDAVAMSHFMKGLYSARTIVSCEQDILTSLKWKLNGPTPLQYIEIMLNVLPESTRSRVEEESKIQVEIAAEDYACVVLGRSTLAVGAVLNSLETVPGDHLPSREREEIHRALSDLFGLDVTGSEIIEAARKRLASNRNKRGRELPQSPKPSLPPSA